MSSNAQDDSKLYVCTVVPANPHAFQTSVRGYSEFQVREKLKHMGLTVKECEKVDESAMLPTTPYNYLVRDKFGNERSGESCAVSIDMLKHKLEHQGFEFIGGMPQSANGLGCLSIFALFAIAIFAAAAALIAVL